MEEVFIVDTCRTPIGKIRGALSAVRADDLMATVLSAILKKHGLNADCVDEIIVGCANQAGEDNRNVARMASVLAGFPFRVPALTVNRLCASGLDAVIMAARVLRLNEAGLMLAGGVESMSRAPLVMAKSANAWGSGHRQLYDSALGWRFPNPRMEKRFDLESMGQTAENIAEHYQISREEQDCFALSSHQKAVAAMCAGRFDDEVIPIQVTDRRTTRTVCQDEGPRQETSLEKLAVLPAVFRDGGSVTPGNSSTLNDGAAAVLLASPAATERYHLKPLARILGYGAAGVEPRMMGMGPVPATQKALAMAGCSIEQMDVIELNEAFAVQSLAVIRELGIAPERVNVNGGAIALGHPLGCSGARILTTLVHQLCRSEQRFGLATLCVGVGQGVSLVIERIS